jgi:lipopolysaccharide export system permease protein
MRTFDRYILSQIFPSLGMTLMVALLILLVERLLRVLDLVLGNSGPLHYVARMLAYLAPHYLGIALPFAFFLAILLTFNRLSRESEFDAFLSAGIGLHQIIRPLLYVTFAVLAIVAVTFNYLQPHAQGRRVHQPRRSDVSRRGAQFRPGILQPDLHLRG